MNDVTEFIRQLNCAFIGAWIGEESKKERQLQRLPNCTAHYPKHAIEFNLDYQWMDSGFPFIDEKWIIAMYPLLVFCVSPIKLATHIQSQAYIYTGLIHSHSFFSSHPSWFSFFSLLCGCMCEVVCTVKRRKKPKVI